MQRHVFAEGNGADDIGTADDANDLISVHHRKPFDLVRRHELGDLFDRGLFVDADNLLAHDRLDVLTLLGEDIGFGHNTDDLTVLGGYRRTADLILDQGHRQIFHRHRWIHGDDISGHYIFGNHMRGPPRFLFLPSVSPGRRHGSYSPIRYRTKKELWPFFLLTPPWITHPLSTMPNYHENRLKPRVRRYKPRSHSFCPRRLFGTHH